MHVHLEGMGLQGSLLAHRLSMYGVPFTWHDINRTETAWKASTGAIYPADSTNHGPDRDAYTVWKSWYEHGYFEKEFLERSGGMVFCTKQPPHKGKYKFTELPGNLRLGEQPSFHFNAQTFVKTQQHHWRSGRKQGPVTADMHIVTHGWGMRLGHAYWGWTRLVKLAYPRVMQPEEHHRPAFYFRPNRYMMAYAYPVPGTDWYYAGSSIMKQAKDKLHELPIVPKYDRWKKTFEDIAQGQVMVKEEGEYLTGWRPAAADEDTAWVRRKGNVLLMRPLWNSGIRHFPVQWAGVATQLGLIP